MTQRRSPVQVLDPFDWNELPYGTQMLVVGSRASGRKTTVRNALQTLRPKYDQVVLLTRNAVVANLLSGSVDRTLSSGFDSDFFESFVPSSSGATKTHTLIVVYDLPRLLRKPAMLDLLMNGRHYGVSVLVVLAGADLKKLETGARNNLDIIISLKGRTDTPEELEDRRRLFFSWLPRERFAHIHKEATRDRQALILNRLEVEPRLMWYRTAWGNCERKQDELEDFVWPLGTNKKWTGAVVGPRQSGKTTILASALAQLSPVFDRTVLVTRSQRSRDMLGHLVGRVVDGKESLDREGDSRTLVVIDDFPHRDKDISGWFEDLKSRPEVCTLLAFQYEKQIPAELSANLRFVLLTQNTNNEMNAHHQERWFRPPVADQFWKHVRTATAHYGAIVCDRGRVKRYRCEPVESAKTKTLAAVLDKLAALQRANEELAVELRELIA